MSFNPFLACILLNGLIFLVASPAHGQTHQGDSLRNIVESYGPVSGEKDTVLINTLIEMATFYRYSEIDSTYKYAEIALTESIKINFERGRLEAQGLRAVVAYNRGEYQKALDISRDALQQVNDQGFKKQRALLNQMIGISYSSLGSFQPGLSYFFKAYELFKEIDNDLGTFQNLNNIGVSYLKLEDYQEALDIFLELDSLRTLEAATISIPVNLGFIYYELGQLDSSEKQLKRVLAFDGVPFDQRAIGLSTFKLGEIYLQKNKYSLAIESFKHSIDKYEELGNELEKVQSLNGIAKTYIELEKLGEALSFARQAYRIATNQGGLPEKQTSTQTLYNVYRAQGDFKNALIFYEMYKAFSDSLSNDDISRQLGKLEAEYEFREKELQMREAQQQQNIENAQQVSTRNAFIFISLSLLLVAVVVAYLQYRNSALRKKANELLRQKNDHIEQQAERLEEMNDIKTHLFSIIAHDLRGPLSSLYGFITLKEMDQLTNENIQKMIPDLADKFKYTSNLLNNLLNWAKSQLDGYTVIPEQFNLKATLVENIKLLGQQAKEKKIIFQNDLAEEVLVYADKNMISIVLLNLLSNAVKFTNESGKIRLWTIEMETEVQFNIQDSGIGIPKNKLKIILEESNFYSTRGTSDEQGTGLGLILCKDFIAKNKGTFWAESEVGSGSTFRFTIPKNQSSFDNRP